MVAQTYIFGTTCSLCLRRASVELESSEVSSEKDISFKIRSRSLRRRFSNRDCSISALQYCGRRNRLKIQQVFTYLVSYQQPLKKIYALHTSHGLRWICKILSLPNTSFFFICRFYAFLSPTPFIHGSKKVDFTETYRSVKASLGALGVHI